MKWYTGLIWANFWKNFGKIKIGMNAPERNIKGVKVKLDIVVAISLFFDIPAIKPPMDKVERIPINNNKKRIKMFPFISSP